jgi:hypothetical protein
MANLLALGEPRRSGRATKGQHTKLLEDDAPPKPEKKGRSKSKKSSEQPDDESDADIIRCICGATEDEDGWKMVFCEQCSAWQHNLCMGVTEEDDKLPNEYYCEQCRPQDHTDLLAALKRGEKPWQERIVKRREEEKAKKGKKGSKKAGERKSARQSTASEAADQSAASTPAKVAAEPPAPAVVPSREAGSKRKFDAIEGGSNGHQPVRILSDSTTASNPDQTPVVAIPAPEPEPSTPVTTTPIASPTVPAKPAAPSQASAKRTKSVSDGRRESVLSPLPKAESLDQLSKDRVPVAKALTTELKLIVPRLIKNGGYALHDGDTADACALRTALSIEHGIHSKYRNNLGAYGSQFRAIRFNIKKNENLVIRILNSVILPEELAEMSSMDMASEELQKERAAVKDEADKQAVLAHEEGPRYRKTHKGDELIGDEPQAKPVEAYTAPVRRRTADMEASPVMPMDTGSPTMDEPTSPSERRGSSERPSFNINQVWSSIATDPSKAGLIQRPPKRRTSSGIHKQDVTMRDAADDPDLDRLLNDDVDMPSSPADMDPTVLWTGEMHMPNVGSFRAVARFGAGGDVGQRVPYADLLFPSLEIDGRIPIARADEYVAGMRYSATTDVCVLAVRPADTDRDRRGFDDVFGYFRDKQRWGVVARHRHADVRDMYVVTVEAGAGPLPGFLTMLDQSEIEPLRPHNLLLLTMVVRTRPGGGVASGAGAPAVSPAVPQGLTPPSSRFSPVTAGPHSSGFGQPFGAVPPVPAPSPSPSAPVASPYPALPPAVAPAMSNLAIQILGPYVASPVVTQILTSVSDMTHVQLQNLRDILEREPATRTDILRLSEHLAQRQQASSSQ